MRLILHYTPMVGVPLLGVALALRLGRTLEAPPTVGGTWSVIEAPAPGDGCAALARLGALHEVRIAQSGPALTATLRGARGSVVLAGALDAGDPAAGGIPLHAANDTIGLRAVVRRDLPIPVMLVSLTRAGCGTLPEFSATRGVAGRPARAGGR